MLTRLIIRNFKTLKEGVGVIDLASFVYVATVVSNLHDQVHRDELSELDALEGLVTQAGAEGQMAEASA